MPVSSLPNRPRVPEIHVTVAAVIEREGRFLLVEERCQGKLVLNQPAGHLEPNESILEAVARETREETGHGFSPESLIGIYHWQNEAQDTFVRFAFTGQFTAPTGPVKLDTGIVAVHWLTSAQIRAREHDLRSPTVRSCIDDYLAGVRHPLELVRYLGWPEAAKRATK